ncbi:MAG: hypothetical protein WAM91_08075 [Candidatus Acidiferrales bacterium]
MECYTRRVDIPSDKQIHNPRNIPALLVLAAFLSALLLFSDVEAAPQVQWIQFQDGRLIYGKDELGNRIPDFSTAGYEGGGVSIPDVPVHATLDPLPAGDDTPRIQSAIDALAKQPLDANGFRGALLLHAGTYRIAGTINLNASGIVLRGEGSGEAGSNLTVLIAQGAPRSLIRIAGEGSWQASGHRHDILDDYVPVGANAITVDDDNDLKAGDRIIVQWSMDAAFIHSIGMDKIPPRRNGGTVRQWEPGMKLRFDRRIVAVDRADKGERITLDAPLTTSMHRSEGTFVGRYTFPGRISHVGIENLRTDGSAFEKAPDFGNPQTRDDQDKFVGGGYFDSLFAAFDSVENAWMRNVVVAHYPRIVSIDQFARAVTVRHIQGIDINTPETSAPPHAFGIDGQQNLVEDCSVAGAYNHVLMTQSRVAGPNVFRNCSAKGAHLDAGPHERWATGTLYENLRIEGAIRIENRSNMGSGHGWSGANNVLWNCEAESYVVQTPPGAYNWAFGMKGSLDNAEAERLERRRGQWIPENRPGQIISPGNRVEPPSLYEKQLKERLHQK